MKIRALVLLSVFCALTEIAVAADDLERQFASPPSSARPSCFWWWFNSLVDKPGITRDLEEFKAKGMGAVVLVCTGNDYGVGPMPRGPVFLSPEWRELYQHALKECDRLGLEMGVNFCGGGWDMGGAWIKPEYSSRWFVQSQLSVSGPRKLTEPLPLPGYRDGYEPPHHGNVNHYMTWPKEKADYRDTAVVAFREPEGGGADLDARRRSSLAAKSNRKDGPCGMPVQQVMAPPLESWPELPADKPIKLSDVIDLTSRLLPDGTLNWEVPEGRWTILRTGHVVMGCDVRCVLPEVGYVLEIDWLNPDAVDEMFTHLGKILLEDAGPLAGKTLKCLHTDSFEDGFPNWTGRMLEQFKQYRGYDPTPYLPVFAGKMVGSAVMSDRFLYDYRKTVADCMADVYGRFAERARQYGLEIECEAAGPSWSQTACMDALKNLGRCGRPMGEFWQGGTLITDNQNYVGKQTAAASHIYGRRTASAEAFTSFLPHWSEGPSALKPTADRAFCEGINRFVFHTMTSTRPQDGLPGYEYGAGTHFNPNVTWWQQAAGPWLSYVDRCQALLQSGLFVADVLYYNGDWVPNLVEAKHADPSLGKGYDYDVCNAEVLLTRLSVKDGRVVLPDGMSYRLLVLPDSKRMPVEVLQKIQELVKAGATVVGPRPDSDPGLRDYPRCDTVLRETAALLWGDLDGQTATERKVGRGRIIWGRQLRQVLQGDGVPPDFSISGNTAPEGGLSRASWIWHAADGLNAPVCDREFRTVWDLPSAVRSARVSITADNTFALKVNGQSVAQSDNWQQVITASLGSFLHAGRNQVEIRAHNGPLPGAAGLIAKLSATLADGRQVLLSTGPGWDSSGDGRNWAPVLVVGDYGCPPWGTPDNDSAQPFIDFIHRATSGADIYFVANRNRRPETMSCTFRVRGRQPELWDPVSGAMRDLPQFQQEGGRTTVPLEFESYGSMFVVFRKVIPTTEVPSQKPEANFLKLVPVQELVGPWTVQFDPQWFYPTDGLSGDQAKGLIAFEKLEDWTTRPEQAVQHFSGTALYRKAFILNPQPSAMKHLFLDLGTVKETALVRLNGKDLGVAWCQPWRVEITGAIKPGENTLEIEVVNLWPNRLMGDSKLPAEQRRTRTNAPVNSSQPAGLLGPVWLMSDLVETTSPAPAQRK